MVICLNGPSSSGKTAIAKELQEKLGGYPLYFSIDNLLYSLPPSALSRMMTGQRNPGLDYSKLEEGFYKSAKSLIELGHNLIIDNTVVSMRSAEIFLSYLGGEQILMVGISCSVEELKRRELQRGDRTIGEAESQVGLVHQFCFYDLMLDSTTQTAEALAAEIKSYIDVRKPLHGLNETKKALKRA